MAGSLAIDVPGYVTVTGGCTKCDPGGVTPPPAVCANEKDDDGDGKTDYPADPGCSSSTDTDETDPVQPPPVCPGTTLTLSVVGSDATTVTLGWSPVAGAAGYRFSTSVVPGKYSHTWDGSRSSVRFAKVPPGGCYRVEALAVIADGGKAG
jgi:hypothetical protein